MVHGQVKWMIFLQKRMVIPLWVRLNHIHKLGIAQWMVGWAYNVFDDGTWWVCPYASILAIYVGKIMNRLMTGDTIGILSDKPIDLHSGMVLHIVFFQPPLSMTWHIRDGCSRIKQTSYAQGNPGSSLMVSVLIQKGAWHFLVYVRWLKNTYPVHPCTFSYLSVICGFVWKWDTPNPLVNHHYPY